LYFIVYVSAAVTWFSPTELRALLASSRLNNERAGITGMLLYKDGNFMQALEGDEEAVRALHTRIEIDRRHRGLLTICSGQADARQFEQWSMAFVDLGSPAEDLPAGYSRGLRSVAEPLPGTAEPFQADRLRPLPPVRAWRACSRFMKR